MLLSRRVYQLAVTRTLFPAILVLPSSTDPTPSSLPISATDFGVPLYLAVEVLAMTFSSWTWEMAVISSSVTPSAKYSSYWSWLMLVNGRTATLVLGGRAAD